MTGSVDGAQLRGFDLMGRNPDVLTCIANLSNDEVFTPPDLANEMLDILEESWRKNHGKDLWSDPTVTFLDPFTKSGVFLREITKRLVKGLAEEFPNLEDRVDHVLTKQVFGIAITRLTALISRRSLYCSKWANGEHSIARSFSNKEGNIWFERVEHTWEGGTDWVLTADSAGKEVKRYTNGRCKFCRAPQNRFDRVSDLDNHAYAFIHADEVGPLIAELFGEEMQFDVIVGNPPYQMTGGGGGSNDSAIYHHFVLQAIALQPRFLSMVIPSRWMAGGRGVKDFREDFLSDRRVRSLVDYENAKDVFPSVGIGGGACYFLWDREYNGQCNSRFFRHGEWVDPSERELDEFDVFVRDPRALTILRKVQARAAQSLEDLVSGDTPFGLATNFKDYAEGTEPGAKEVRIYANVGTRRLSGSMHRDLITKNVDLVDAWKLLLPVAGSGRERERTGVDRVLGPPIVAEPGSVCTQTYLVAGPLLSRVAAKSLESYLKTKLTRFLISLRKPAQHVFRGMYRWVPQQSWDRVWTDSELYALYGLEKDEQAFIEATIRPMDAEDG